MSNNSLFGGQLQRRSNHERVARVIYLRTTDWQTVNYYSRIHALELIYFDSNTINDESTFEVFSFFQLSAIAMKNCRQPWDYVAFVTPFKSKNDGTPSNNMNDVIFSNKWRQLACIFLALSKLWIHFFRQHVLEFPTKWHFDKCRLRRACAASF